MGKCPLFISCIRVWPSAVLRTKSDSDAHVQTKRSQWVPAWQGLGRDDACNTKFKALKHYFKKKKSRSQKEDSVTHPSLADWVSNQRWEDTSIERQASTPTPSSKELLARDATGRRRRARPENP